MLQRRAPRCDDLPKHNQPNGYNKPVSESTQIVADGTIMGRVSTKLSNELGDEEWESLGFPKEGGGEKKINIPLVCPSISYLV